MIRSAVTRALLDQRMERSFARRVILLVVLVAAIGGTCLAKAEGVNDPGGRHAPSSR